MPSLTPSPPLSASSTRRGLVDTVAQTFAGVKTFLAAAVFSAGVQLSLLFGTNGSGAADVVIKAGTTLADASVNANAKILSVRTGLGGTEVVKFAVTPAGIDLFQGAEINFRDVWGLRIYAQSGYIYLNGPAWCASMIASQGLSAPNWNNTGPLIAYRVDGLAGASDVSMKVGTNVSDATVNAGHTLLQVSTGIGGTEVVSLSFQKSGRLLGGAGAGVLTLDGVIGSRLEYGTQNHVTMNSFSVTHQTTGVVIAQTSAADGATAQALYVNASNAWVNVGAALLKLNVQDVARFAVNAFGRVSISGTSSAAGAATINKPAGISGIAAGASSVTITCNQVTATSHVIFSPHNRDATCKELIVTRAAGSFTVSGTANATANLFFSWEVKEII